MKFQVGNSEYCLPDRDGIAPAICQLIQTEEERVLALGKAGVKAGEDILIHLVRMYVLRWAVPAVEIEKAGSLAGTAADIQRRFWLCMFGRATDDLHDRDSGFFSLADSILLTATYSALLQLEPSCPWGTYIFQQTAISLADKQDRTSDSRLTMAEIVKDVCDRVAYFLSPPSVDLRASKLLRRYIGVLLGRCDLDDCLADGAVGANSTAISRALHRSLADPEGKIHLTSQLLNWYAGVEKMLQTEAESLIVDLDRFGATYAAGIVRETFHLSKTTQISQFQKIVGASR